MDISQCLYIIIDGPLGSGTACAQTDTAAALMNEHVSRVIRSPSRDLRSHMRRPLLTVVCAVTAVGVTGRVVGSHGVGELRGRVLHAQDPKGHGFSWLRLRGGNLDLDTLLATAKSPEAAEELKTLMADPEAMAEARAMMDDPEFRAQMMEALASGGGKQLDELRQSLADGSTDLSDTIKSLGPSLGASLDIMKENCATSDEFGQACDVLVGLVRTLVAKGGEDVKYRRVRLSNDALQYKLLRHLGGRGCLEAMGFNVEATVGEAEYLEHDGEGVEDSAADESDGVGGLLGRKLKLVSDAREEANKAAGLSTEHGINYRIALELPAMRRLCAGDTELAQMLTQMLLSNAEFKSHVDGPAAAVALPSILQLMRSKEGIRGVVEYYTGAPLVDSRVLKVSTVSEWKAALDEAADRPVCALFANSAHPGCRILAPIFARLPDQQEGRFANVDFLHICVDASQDDGLASQVFEEAWVDGSAVPTFVFVVEALELKKWRYTGSEISEVVRRLERIAANDRLDDGPGGDDE